MEKRILSDVFDGWMNGNGLFKYLSEVTEMPWDNVETITVEALDLLYFGSHSGSKFCTPLVNILVSKATGVIPDINRTSIANMLITKYLRNWQRLFDTMVTTYNPIHNYDMSESRTLMSADSSSQLSNEDMSEEATNSNTAGNVNYKYGLNTNKNSPKESDKMDSEYDSSSTTEQNTESRIDSASAGEEMEETRRYGNIGVTTTQRLIEEERQIWLWNYFDTVFSDIDKELALMFHDPCLVG